MDHVPRVQGATHRLPSVLYHVDKATEGQKFTDQYLTSYLPSGPSSCHNAIFQECLFFGTLRSVCELYDVPLDRQDFIRIRGEDGQQFITTSLLPDYISAWITKEAQRSRVVLNPKIDGTEGKVKFVKNVLTTSAVMLGDAVLHPDESERLFDSVAKLFRTGEEILNSLSDLSGWESNIDAALWDSVLLLCDALINLGYHLYRPLLIMDCDEDTFFKSKARIGTEVPIRTLKTMLKAQSWCVREAHAIETITSGCPSALAMCVQIDRGQNGQGFDHSKCTVTNCLAYQIDNATYKPQHAFSGCTCDMISLGQEQRHQLGQNVKQFEEHKRYAPMVTWVEGEIKIANLDLKSANRTAIGEDREGFWKSQSARCVAVSHVWADGMGNTRANAMYECQLGRVQVLVNKLYPSKYWPIPFWMDVLCVPAFDNHLRKLAIGQMEWVYKSATKVLVVDSSLLAHDVLSASGEEIGARIMSSTWARRLWTAQEGAWINRVFYQFAKSVYRFQDLESELREKLALPNCQLGVGPSHPLWKIIKESKLKKASAQHLAQYAFGALSPCWNGIARYFREMDLNNGWNTSRDWQGEFGRFSAVMRVIQTRTTSRIEDEPLVVASLLSRKPGNASTIVQTAPADRYRKIFSGAIDWYSFPLDLIFLDVVRYQEDGFRCFPTTLLPQSAPRMETFYRYSERSLIVEEDELERGVWAVLYGFKVQFGSQDTVPRRFEARGRLFEVFEPGTGRFPSNISTRSASWEMEKQFGVLVPDEAAKQFQPEFESRYLPTIAALVSFTPTWESIAGKSPCFKSSYSDGGLRTRFEALLFVRRIDPKVENNAAVQAQTEEFNLRKFDDETNIMNFYIA